MGGHDEQGLGDPPPARAAHKLRDARRGKRGEARLPPAVAVLVAVALYAALPETLVLGPRLLIPGCGGGIAGRPGRDQPLAADPANPMVPVGVAGVGGGGRGHESGDVGIAGSPRLVSAQNSGRGALLLAALQVWATNVIAFGLIYWELDRGGSVARTQIHPREKLPLVLSARFPVHPGRNPGHRHRSRRGIQRKGRLDTDIR